jgi:hypothetical protein
MFADKFLLRIAIYSIYVITFFGDRCIADVDRAAAVERKLHFYVGIVVMGSYQCYGSESGSV